MKHVYEPYLEFLLLIAISPFVAWFLYSTIARLILIRVWKYWYIRRAIDISFVGLIALSYSSFYHDLWHDWQAHNSVEQRATGDRINQLRALTFQKQSGLHAASENLYERYSDLSYLQDWQFFLDNFGNYVVFPSFTMVLIGYSAQRSQQDKDRRSEPQKSPSESNF